MPTPAERKALFFFSGVLLLGTGVRAVRAVREGPELDLAATAALDRQIAAVDSVRAAARTSTGRRRKRTRAAARDSIVRRPVDLDRASAAEIDRLPRVGPVLAARIVADRDSLGPFGSLARLERVKGIGPALLKTLEPHVTFSLPPRQSQADGSGGAARSRERRGARRPRAP